ncbi:UNVERIFIED_CONTAM: hypothetical protein H355_011308, partial [Colinus virginianus]
MGAWAPIRKHEAFVMAQMEKAKATVQCSRVWLRERASTARAKAACQQPSPLLVGSSEVLSSWPSPRAVPLQDIDFSNRLLAQHETRAALEQQLRARKEKRQALTDTLRQLELKHAGLKFRQPPGASRGTRVALCSYRKLEAELRVRLQQEKARLEQARGSYLRQQELHSLLEIVIDNLVARLHGITVPEQ